VRFQRRGADGQFIDVITDAGERPSLAESLGSSLNSYFSIQKVDARLAK
jgi:hypothetical protein